MSHGSYAFRMSALTAEHAAILPAHTPQPKLQCAFGFTTDSVTFCAAFHGCRMSLSQKLFQYRGYTPVPFVIVMVVFANPTLWSLVSGFLIACAGEFLRAWGVFYVGSETRVTGNVGASRLVMGGPFSYVRNPLYVGNMLIYLGVGIMSLTLFPWLQVAALLFFLWQYTLIVREEEKFLRERFGDEYAAYRKAVPRFLFRLTPYRPSSRFTIDWSAGWKSEVRTLQALVIVTVILVALWLVRQ